MCRLLFRRFGLGRHGSNSSSYRGSQFHTYGDVITIRRHVLVGTVSRGVHNIIQSTNHRRISRSRAFRDVSRDGSCHGGRH